MSEEKQTGEEPQRLERLRELADQIDEKDGELYLLDTDMPDYKQRRDYIQGEINQLKVEVYCLSSDKERVQILEEGLSDHEMMHEISGGEYQVNMETIVYGAFCVEPGKEDFSPYLADEIKRIKSENPWIEDSEE